MSKFFRSLRLRLIVLVLLALLPAFGLALYTDAQQRQHILDHMQEDTLSLAHNLAIYQKELVSGTRYLLMILAQLPIVRGADAAACSSYLAELKSKNPEYMNILKWDLEGNLLCDAEQSPLPHRLPVMDNLHQVLENNDFTIINYFVRASTGEQALSFGYPISDDEGNLKAVLFASIHLEALNELFTPGSLPAGSTITLRDHNGVILGYYPEPEAWLGKVDPKISAAPALAHIEAEGTVVTQGSDGIERLYAYMPVYGPIPDELTLIVGIPYREAMAEVDQTLRRNLLILGLAGLIALLAIGAGGEILLLNPMDRVLGVTRRLTKGDLTARTGLTHVASELSELALSIDQMAEALEKRERESHENQVILIKQEQARVQLLHELITAHEDERMRVAHELHDETSQNITALMLGLDTAALALEKDPKHAGEYFERVKLISKELLEGIHGLIFNLRPSMLDDLGLVPAIHLYADKRLKPLGISLRLEDANPGRRLPVFIETALFRVVQEAFTNVIRHSNARNVDIQLTQMDHTLEFIIQDDGRGFDPTILTAEAPGKGFGLRGMQERVDMLDGRFEIESALGEGTRIIIHIPIPKVEVVHVRNSSSAGR